MNEFKRDERTHVDNADFDKRYLQTRMKCNEDQREWFAMKVASFIHDMNMTETEAREAAFEELRK